MPLDHHGLIGMYIRMDTGHQALVLFYAFFWAAAISVTVRYQPFDTPSAWVRESRAIKRLLVSLLILNILPILWFFFLYKIIPDDNRLPSIIAAAVASLSVFGFHRILHAFIASESMYQCFYTLEQVKEVRDRGKFTQPQTFSAHFIPGLLYIIVPGGIAWLITLL
jgi:hypothetical protein